MPQDAINHVGELGQCQHMPKTLTFADRCGFKLPDADDEVGDDHDSNYKPDDEDNSDNELTLSRAIRPLI
jgi:hypothetical protein